MAFSHLYWYQYVNEHQNTETDRLSTLLRGGTVIRHIDAFIRRNPKCTLMGLQGFIINLLDYFPWTCYLLWCHSINIQPSSLPSKRDLYGQLATIVFIQTECNGVWFSVHSDTVTKPSNYWQIWGMIAHFKMRFSKQKKTNLLITANCWLCQKSVYGCSKTVWLGLLSFCPIMETSKWRFRICPHLLSQQ